MTDVITITVFTPPSLNKLWSSSAHGRIRSAAYRAWSKTAGWDVRRQMVGIPILACRYDMEIQAPISRRDSGNFEKAVGDLLQDVGVVTNDGNCNDLLVRRIVRDDCLVILTPRPDLGNVRAPPPWVKPKKRQTPIKRKPSQAELDHVAALQKTLRF